ncbi:ABC-2 transporter permease [Staphylococcus ureilyticus]|uniref:ABC-2 transporter permease n=1 Tax=Staphylococcus ureilyticus TaxID=94138 RepID=UPI00321995ED
MKGLLLSSYYLTRRSIWGYLILAIIVSIIVVLFANNNGERFSLMIILLLASLPSLEMIKKENASNYDKYLLTLPIKRLDIVMNHYIYYLLAITLGILVSFVYWITYTFFFNVQDIQFYFSSLGSILFIVIVAGAITFPSLYIMGHSKSDVIIIASGMIGLLLNIILQGFFSVILPKINILNIHDDLLASFMYLLLSLLIYLISFYISRVIYEKKDF